MIILYNFIISLYKYTIYIASLCGNEKAILWYKGRINIFEKIKNDINKTHNEKTKTIWIHVASLGEFEQGRPLIEAIKKKIPHCKIILTFFSPSGYEMRKNYISADHVFYLPLDTKANAKQFLNIIKPDIAIFIKYEFWLHYLTTLHNRHIPTLLVSAIFREKQFAKWNPYTPLFKKILNNFTYIFLQDTPSVNLLKKQGFTHITRAGDTRVDRVAHIAEQAQTLPLIQAFIADAPVFIGGSTWEADELLIKDILYNENFNNWKFIIAPHEIGIKNIIRIEQLFKQNTIRYSQLINNENTDKNENVNTLRILIIDNIGLLSSLYRYGKIAYIGGGFGRGIHNTLEPIAFGLPVIFGPKYQKFAEAVQLVETGGGFSIQKNDMLKVMNNLNIKENYDKATTAAKDYIIKNKGATEQIMTFIEELLKK